MRRKSRLGYGSFQTLWTPAQIHRMTVKIPVLVVGGAGYIGSHCSKALSDAGYLPVCFDNFSTGHRHFAKWGPLIEGDVRETDLVKQTIQQHQIAAVVHFAAHSLVGESVADPQKYYWNNVGGTLSLLRAMRDAGCSRLVFSSTGAVYGHASSGSISEQSPCSPVNPYGASKWMVERILSDSRTAYQLNSTCFRYFNASGADASGDIGELHEVETHLIPRAMMAIQGYVDDFAVYGADYDTEDGTAVRDYIHVTDLAAAHVAAISRLIDGHSGGTYNLGTGKGFSVKEVLRAIAQETGQPVPHTIKARRAGDPPSLIADPTLAAKELNFVAKHSELPNIIQTAWAWHQAHPQPKETAAP